jgi:two-component system phosphate regulon response regulator PhoB
VLVEGSLAIGSCSDVTFKGHHYRREIGPASLPGPVTALSRGLSGKTSWISERIPEAASAWIPFVHTHGGTALRKILIVDDEEAIRELVDKTLRGKDRIILKADTAEKAVEVAVAEIPDLIMMDIMMPGEMDGLDAARIIKSDARTKHCTILILTAKGRAADREEGMKSGAKPFSPLELMRKVDEIIDS